MIGGRLAGGRRFWDASLHGNHQIRKKECTYRARLKQREPSRTVLVRKYQKTDQTVIGC